MQHIVLLNSTVLTRLRLQIQSRDRLATGTRPGVPPPYTEAIVVFVPHRGDLPARHGPDVQTRPDIPASTLDASVYLDAERYELEREKIFLHGWLIMCRSNQVAGPGDFITWEGHGESVVISRRADGGLSGFHNVCQHRGARIVNACSGKNTQRFNCRWHNWVYDQEGAVRGVPERPEFDRSVVKDLCAPPVAVDEWGGWVWALLGGPDAAPPLAEWIGKEILGDLGAYQMQNMRLVEKLEWDLPVNWKVVVDGFNENYHAPALHHVSAQDVKDGRESSFFVFGRNAMMVVPYKGVLEELRRTGDHQATAICHYTVFPNQVFNCNPNHIQLFHPVPLAVDRTRFECWELWYPDGDQEYLDKVGAHWEHLKEVVGEDVEIFNEWAAVSRSHAYTRNVFGRQECKLTAFHQTCEEMLRE